MDSNTAGKYPSDGNPTLSYLSDLIAAHPLNEKILVVPSFHIGHQIGEALAASGCSWINLRTATLSSLALDTAGAELAASGVTRIPGMASRLILNRILRDLKAAGLLPFFGRLEIRSGIVNAIHRSLRELRLSNISGSDLKPELFIDPQKGRELSLILTRYEEALAAANQVDSAGLYTEAISLLKKRPSPPTESGSASPQAKLPHDSSKTDPAESTSIPSTHTPSDSALPSDPPASAPLILRLENHILMPLEKAFLQSLAGDKLFIVPEGRVFGLDRPRRFLPPSDLPPIPKPPTNLGRAPWLFDPKQTHAPSEDDTLTLFSAVGLSNECREICRGILAHEIPFDSVAVLHPQGSHHPASFFSLAEKTGLKITSQEGFPLALTIPGKVFNTLSQWLENDFPEASLRMLIESGCLKMPESATGYPLAALTVARTLRAAGIGWGRSRYLPRLRSVADAAAQKAKAARKEKNDTTAERLETQADAAYRTRRWIKEILELLHAWPESAVSADTPVPPPSSSPSSPADCPLSELTSGLSSVLRKYCRVTNALDREALAFLSSRLDASAPHACFLTTREEALEWLRQTAENLRVGASNPAPGHLHLAPYTSGAFTARPLTFITGLDQTTVPGSRLPDPILLDEERRALSPDLVLTADKLRENLYLMASLLSSLNGRAVLSFSAYDMLEDKPSFPSSLLLQVFRLITGDPSLDYTALMSALGEPGGFIPSWSLALDATDWWLGRIAPSGRFRSAEESVRLNFPLINVGVLARAERTGPRLSSHDGLVSVSREEVHPCVNSKIVMSASRFETLGACPFLYFLKYILHIRPPDDLVLDRSRWLDPLQRGELLHEIYCRFMRTITQRGETASPSTHSDLLHTLARELIARTREANPPPSEAVYAREVQELLLSCDVFLHTESIRTPPVEPLLFEVRFGQAHGDDDDDDTPAADAVPIAIPAEKPFRLNGRIDRIDRTSPHTYRVIDYKTGSYNRYEDLKAFGKGRCLQPALYAQAAGILLSQLDLDASPRIAQSGYAFPTLRGDGREILIDTPDLKTLQTLLSELLHLLDQGHFLAPPDAQCSYCDYAPLCGPEAQELARQKKLANPEAYAVFDRLNEYE